MNATTTKPAVPAGEVSVTHPSMQSDNVLFLDVRTPVEFEEVHIPGSALHPLDRLNPEEIKKLTRDKSACVIVCRSGNRAKQAAEKLQNAGLSVQVLQGGVSAWQAAGLPVNQGRKAMSLERQVRIAAGLLVLSGVILGFLINPVFFFLSGFVGCGLIFAGVTDWCGMGLLLARAPWNQVRSSSHASGCCAGQPKL